MGAAVPDWKILRCFGPVNLPNYENRGQVARSAWFRDANREAQAESSFKLKDSQSLLDTKD